VVRAAACVGLQALAITDHDSVSGLESARTESKRLNVAFIAGIELTAERNGREMHILGYFVRENDPHLLGVTQALRKARAERIREMAGRLQALGLWIDTEALARAFPRAALGRKHLADWLRLTGQTGSNREAFQRYLGDGGPAEVPKPRLPYIEAIALIRASGGLAGLAHPPYDLREHTLSELAEVGLQAIEVDGPGIDVRRSRRWRAWAEKHDLVPTAGSDFHAPDRTGRWVGSITTPTSDLIRLREKAAIRSS
jgi:predicted metal-dependent phosphoesterase TrpH